MKLRGDALQNSPDQCRGVIHTGRVVRVVKDCNRSYLSETANKGLQPQAISQKATADLLLVFTCAVKRLQAVDILDGKHRRVVGRATVGVPGIKSRRRRGRAVVQIPAPVNINPTSDQGQIL